LIDNKIFFSDPGAQGGWTERKTMIFTAEAQRGKSATKEVNQTWTLQCPFSPGGDLRAASLAVAPPA
jgi:hypothetical protein